MKEQDFQALVAKIDEDSDSQFGPSMIDVQKIIDHAKKLREALIWCSGSGDFGSGGIAEIGWNKLCRPLIQ